MGDFDPNEHTVAEVQEHLAEADPSEAEQILEAEKAGKARKTVLGADEMGNENVVRRNARGRILNAWELNPQDQLSKNMERPER